MNTYMFHIVYKDETLEGLIDKFRDEKDIELFYPYTIIFQIHKKADRYKLPGFELVSPDLDETLKNENDTKYMLGYCKIMIAIYSDLKDKIEKMEEQK